MTRTTISGKGTLIYKPVEPWLGTNLKFLPNLAWNFKNAPENPESEEEELIFSLPLQQRLDKSGINFPQNIWRIYYNPFYLTDFDFDGGIVGFELSLDPHVQFSNGFEIGSYRILPGFDYAAYQIGVLPKLRYSKVTHDSLFIAREDGDKELTAGVDLQFFLRPFGTKSGWELQAGYGYEYDFDSEEVDKNIDYRAFKAMYWFTDHLGVFAETKNGTSSITKQEVDATTFSIEARF